jgi:hypothetical protein
MKAIRSFQTVSENYAEHAANSTKFLPIRIWN